MARIRDPEHGAEAGQGAGPVHAELYRCYREVFFAHNAKGIVDVLGEMKPIPPPVQAAVASNGTAPPDASANGPLPAAHLNGDQPAAEDPQLSIVVPVWSRTPELA